MRHTYYRWDRTTDEVVPCGDMAAMASYWDIDHRRVARTELPNGVTVYTTFLGINHGWGGPPLVFETMAEGPGGWFDYQERYSTAREAREGHGRAVAYFSQDPLPTQPE